MWYLLFSLWWIQGWFSSFVLQSKWYKDSFWERRKFTWTLWGPSPCLSYILTYISCQVKDNPIMAVQSLSELRSNWAFKSDHNCSENHEYCCFCETGWFNTILVIIQNLIIAYPIQSNPIQFASVTIMVWLQMISAMRSYF